MEYKSRTTCVSTHMEGGKGWYNHKNKNLLSSSRIVPCTTLQKQNRTKAIPSVSTLLCKCQQQTLTSRLITQIPSPCLTAPTLTKSDPLGGTKRNHMDGETCKGLM